MCFAHHPIFAPLVRLTEAYQRSDIVSFNERIGPALMVFRPKASECDPFYAGS